MKACQRRAGDVLWQMAMEIDLIKASKEIIGVLERAYDEVSPEFSAYNVLSQPID